MYRGDLGLSVLMGGYYKVVVYVLKVNYDFSFVCWIVWCVSVDVLIWVLLWCMVNFGMLISVGR